MKQITFLVAFYISALSFAQNTGAVTGNLLDIESNNAPLMFAKVSIKETGAETLSDEKGTFKFINLKEGTYTLVYSFTGYETKESLIKVTASKITSINLNLAASSISLDDLMLTLASVDKKETTSISNK